MGATAITVVAGARIVQMADAPMVAATRGLIAGTAVLFWAFGTWLIPPPIAAGVWRHVVHRIPLRYEATAWSVVFPLGMYGVGSALPRSGRPSTNAGGDRLRRDVGRVCGMGGHVCRDVASPGDQRCLGRPARSAVETGFRALSA